MKYISLVKTLTCPSSETRSRIKGRGLHFTAFLVLRTSADLHMAENHTWITQFLFI